MTASRDLHSILFKALEDTAQVFTGHVQDAEAYIAEGKAHLLAHLLDPPMATVAIPGDHARSCKVKIDRLEGYALAKSKDYWLLYCPDDELFWLAWGSDPLDLGLSGFSGTDALEVWLC